MDGQGHSVLMASELWSFALRPLLVLVSLVFSDQMQGKQKWPVLLRFGEEAGGPDQLISSSHQALSQHLSLSEGQLKDHSALGSRGHQLLTATQQCWPRL